MTVLGSKPPAKVTINEITTVASVWTHAQFLDRTAIKGPALGLRIAAGNVPNFVDLQTGGWGDAIQSPLNDGETPTMANFATLADALAGCVTRVTANACDSLFLAATPPKGDVPTDTLAAAQSVARYPWYKPERLFALIGEFYQIPPGKNMRAVPFMPYLNVAPSAWVLPLKFGGGGYRAGGKAMFDSEGNLWVGDNFTVGWQGTDSLWQGNATKFDPNGKPLSPTITGFSGGGMEGGTFGAAVDAKDNAWFGTYGGKSIAVFDKNGKPLTPPEGITFGGRLGLMQGIIATPNGDVWAVGISKGQLVHFPKGDPDQGSDHLRGARRRRTLQVLGGAVPPCHRPAGPDLGVEWLWRARDAISGVRPEQGREIRHRVESRGYGHRQPRQCLGNQSSGQRGARGVRSRQRYPGLEDRRQRRRGPYDADVSANGHGWRQCHAAASGWLAISRLAVHGRRSARPVRGGRGRQ